MTTKHNFLANEEMTGDEIVEGGSWYLLPFSLNMTNVINNLKAYFTEEIRISPKYLVKCYIEDYGKDGEKLFTKEEELTRDRYYRGRTKSETGMRLFCRDCPYYKKCKGIKWEIGCEPKKELFEIIEKYGGKE